MLILVCFGHVALILSKLVLIQVKLVSHWAATLGDKLRTTFVMEFLKCLKRLYGLSIFSRELI